MATSDRTGTPIAALSTTSSAASLCSREADLSPSGSWTWQGGDVTPRLPQKICRSAGSKQGTPTLVWCHEGCHKSTWAPVRDQLAEAADGVGGKLRCLKAATAFDLWAQDTNACFFLLLVNWREAKPCGKILLRRWREMPPHALVVRTESAKQYRQGLEWANGLALQGYSRRVIIQPTDSSHNDVACYAARILLRESAELEPPWQIGEKTRQQEVRQPPRSLGRAEQRG